MKVEINRERCKECGLCMHHCPKGAITKSAVLNNNGYYPVQIDDEKCIGCGICYTTCPDGVFHVLG
jgi:2-oxoglutarate ferredoxin oxidoreductase subunit delta